MSNLIINGNFQTGDLFGWTKIQTQNVFVSSPGYNSSYCYFIGNYNTFSPLISQTITTIPGNTYKLSYYLKNGTTNGYNTQFSALINNIQIPGSYINTNNPYDWTLFEFNFVAISSLTTLSFNSYIDFLDPTYLYLDSISIINITPPPVPVDIRGIKRNFPNRLSSNSNGQFWYGSTTNFPGFLYKKNVGVGTRRSTKFTAGGNFTTNSYQYLYNKYKPGTGGVGASSIANRRAKNRIASDCGGQNSHCGPFYQYLGRYNNYTENPNGYFPYPPNQNN